METATTVVITYKPMVRPPIADNFEISFKSDTPLIKDAKIKGTAISFKAFINILPNGFIQSCTNSLPPSNWVINTPTKTPITIPKRICQCNAIFFIINF